MEKNHSGDLSRIAVIGLGNMGSGMALSLLRGGFEVTGYDTSESARAKAGDNGVVIAASAIDAVSAADAVVTMLPDSADAESALLGDEGVIRAIRTGGLLIESSTIAPASTDKFAVQCQEVGIDFVDAPVGRSPAEAAAGTLLFMVGGDALERARPLLEVMGDTVIACGRVGGGIRTKLVLNLLSQATCQLSAEVVALGLKLGLPRAALLDVLGNSLGSNGFITRYWPTKVLRGDTEPGFAIRLSAKDMRLASAMADEAGVCIPTGAAAAAAIAAAAKHHPEMDVSGLLQIACANAGVNERFHSQS